MPQIAAQDEVVLQRLLAPMTEIPDKMQQDYFLLQRLFHNGVRSGPMSPELLCWLVFQSGLVSLPKPVEAKFGTVQEGAKVFWRTNEYQEENAVFLRCVEPRELGLCEIAVFGTVHRVPESQLSLVSRTDEGRVVQSQQPQAEEKLVPSPHAAIEPEPSPAANPFAAATNSDEPQEPAKSLKEILKEMYPKGSTVECAIPGEVAFSGEVDSVGSGQFSGRLRVRTATGLRWVPAEHVMKETAA